MMSYTPPWNLLLIDTVDVRAVNPRCLQILRIDVEGMITDVIMHRAHDVICKKRHKKDVGIVTFDLIGLLPTNHINAYITMSYWSL